jgi:hypothetical protein
MEKSDKELFNMRFVRCCHIHAYRKYFLQTREMILGVLRPLTITLSVLLMFGCGGGYEGFTHVPPSITLEPVAQSEALGLTATFAVIVTGTAPLTFQWFKGGVAIGGATSSSYTTPATLVADNGAVFTVVVSNAAGSVTSAPIILTVTPAVLKSIAVTASSLSIAKGTTQLFIATGTYSDGTTVNITTSVAWASASTSVATIAPSTGVATSVTAGTSQITATQGSISSPAVTLTVTTATLKSIAVTASSLSVVKGTTLQFIATGSYSDGTTQVITTSVTWASASTLVATIGPSTGVATGATAGTSQISATQGSISSPAVTLTVINSTLATSLVCKPALMNSQYPVPPLRL